MPRHRPKAARARLQERCRILHGEAKDAANDVADAAVNYLKDAYDNSGDNIREGQKAMAKTVQDNPLGALLGRGRNWICTGAVDDAPAAPPAAPLAVLRLIQAKLFEARESAPQHAW